MAKKRTVRIHVLLTPEEHGKLKELAFKDGRGVGPYLRRVAGVEVTGDNERAAEGVAPDRRPV